MFRRAIDVNAADKSERFDYDAYYYDADSGKYYKVSNLNVYQDSQVANHTPSETVGEEDDLTKGTWTFTDYMGDGINNDGTLMVASGSFRKEITDYVDPMDLTYLKLSADEVDDEDSEYYGMDQGQYLVASYDRGNNAAMAAATAAAEAYDKAIHEFEYAEALFNAAQDEYDVADGALNNANIALNGDPDNPTTTPGATKNLTDAQANYQNALAEYNNKLTAYNNALDKLKETKAVYENSMKKLYGNAAGGTTASTETAGGEANKYTADSLYGKYMAAKKAREDAHIGDNYDYTGAGENKGIEDEFNAYIAANSSVTATDYTDLDTAGLKAFRDWVDDNTTAEEHDHWMLVIDELIAKTNYDNEKARCLGTTGTSYANAEGNTYGKAYYDALEAYESAYKALGDKDKTNGDFDTYKDGAVLVDGDKLTADSGAKAALNTAKSGLETAQGNYDIALSNYQYALEESNAAEELRDAVAALRAAAEKAQTEAATAYSAVSGTDSLSESDGAVKIYIKLNDDAVITDQTNATNETWYLDPVTLGGNDNVTTGTLLNNKAVFYYNGLLEGGETSSKLVDYVLLDPHATQNDYKNFDFDINVALKSAQINLDESGNIKTDAAQAELAKFATYNNGTATSDADQVVKWSDAGSVPAAAAATTFVVGTTPVDAPSSYTGTGALEAYRYQITLTSDQATAIGTGTTAGTYLCETQVGTYKLLNGASVDSTKTINVQVG